MLLALLVGACAGAEPLPAPPATPEVTLSTDLATLRSRSDLVFQGRVVSLGAAPGAWSGLVRMEQEVRWELERVFVGERQPGETIPVLHPVVARSRTAGSSPGLDPSLFAVGSSHLVFARHEGGIARCISEHDGVLPPDPKRIAELSRPR